MKNYMIRRISEMLEASDIVIVEAVYHVIRKLTVADKRHFRPPLKISLEKIEHMFYH